MELLNFLHSHPDDWYNILSQDPYNLKIKRDEGANKGLILFEYNQIDSDMSLPLVQECRGIILDSYNNWEIISYPFNKFFNYGEPNAADIDWRTAHVQEKIDGSIIKLAYFKRAGRWLVSTNGCINAFQVPINGISTNYLNNINASFGSIFTEAFLKTCSLDKLNKNHTYMFELVSPYNKIVINYPETKIYHIGTRNNTTLKELNIDIGVEKPKEYPLHSLNAVISAAEALNKDEEHKIDHEGFVVVDANWNRVKIKSPLYLSAHYLAGNRLTIKNCVDIILSNELDEYLTYFPDQKPAFQNIFNILEELENILDDGWTQVMTKWDINDRKEFALNIAGDKWKEYYFKKIKWPDLTSQQYLRGGYKYFSKRHQEWRETPPVRGLVDIIKEYMENKQ